MIASRFDVVTFKNADPELFLDAKTPDGKCGKPLDRKGFLLSLDINFNALPPREKVVLADIPGVLSVVRRFSTARQPAAGFCLDGWKLDSHTDEVFDRSQHYVSFPMPDGSVPVLECRMELSDADHPKWREIRVGIPQSIAPASGTHRLDIFSDFSCLRMYLDGSLADENFVYGYPVSDQGITLRIDPAAVTSARLFMPAPEFQKSVEYRDLPVGMQYYSTAFFNSWVGDVVPFYHDGMLHLFYLHDRRHHGSKFGTGAHYYGHFTTRDLVEWHEEAPFGMPENQFETCGTGTPFFRNGQYFFAYGLHTDRFTPYETNAGALLRREAGAQNTTHPIRMADLPADCHPEGMTYAVSSDGLTFTKSGILTHFSENPSVYTMPDNTIRMYADGVWKAEDIASPWQLVRRDFPPCDQRSEMRNTLECPSFFEWDGRYYLFVGMDGFYRSDSPDFTEYEDLAAQGRDLYDGLLVPMAVPWRGGRELICGWIFPFGSYFVFREIVRVPGSSDPGLRWVPEMMPAIEKKEKLADEFPENRIETIDREVPDFCEYEMTVDGSRGGRFALRFLPPEEAEGVPGCEFSLDLDAKTAQFHEIEPDKAESTAFMPALKTMRETVAEWRDRITIFKEMPYDVKRKCHVFSYDFLLDLLKNTDREFTLRIILKFDQKMNATLIDAEIAGCRTMVSLRSALRVDSVSVLADGKADVRDLVKYVFRPEQFIFHPGK